MVKRLHLEAGRLVLSRPGQVASPTLDNAHKILDSEWGYAGLLIASGVTADPQYPVGGDEHSSITPSSQSWEIPFPDAGYKPSVVLMTYRESTGYIWAYSNWTTYGLPSSGRIYNIQVGTDRITFGRIREAATGQYWIHNSKIIYMVFGFA